MVLAFRYFFLLLLAATLPTPAAATIFGDGNPKNGPEDDRIPIPSQDAVLQPLKATGTIECDGVEYGSGTVLDVSDFANAHGWTIIAAAAHVFFNPVTHRMRKSCIFIPYLGRDFRRQLDLTNMVMGDYIPHAHPKLTDFINDWAFVALGGNMSRFGSAMKPLATNDRNDLLRYVQSARHGLAVVGYNESEHEQTVSMGCGLVALPRGAPDRMEDKVFFTNCDAKPGASGGAVSVHVNDGFYLVGLFTGQFWRGPISQDGQPAAVPIDGSRFSPTGNANIFRVFDPEMMDAIRQLVSR